MNTETDIQALETPDMALRRHSVRLAVAADPATCAAATQTPGLLSAQLAQDGRQLQVAYDVRQLTFGQVLQCLGAAGIVPAAGRWAALRATWWNYLDGNARSNLANRGAPCCSNPTEIYAKRRGGR